MNAASTTSPDEVLVLGAGFAGLATASYLAKAGHRVRVVERHDTLGGRARKFEAEGFTFDMGPSWYWMPDVFERYFKDFGADVNEEMNLVRLDPLIQCGLRMARSRSPRGSTPWPRSSNRLKPAQAKSSRISWPRPR